MITLSDIQPDELDLIQDLWERNRLYHVAVSKHFSKDYENIRFEDRMKPLRALPEEELKISIARNNADICGYCISTAKNGSGELVSLHVLDTMRGKGVGRQLSEYHLHWIKEKGCEDVTVHVAVENESTIGFYQQLGFCSNVMIMQMKK